MLFRSMQVIAFLCVRSSPWLKLHIQVIPSKTASYVQLHNRQHISSKTVCQLNKSENPKQQSKCIILIIFPSVSAATYPTCELRLVLRIAKRPPFLNIVLCFDYRYYYRKCTVKNWAFSFLLMELMVVIMCIKFHFQKT